MTIYSLDILLSQFWTSPFVPCVVLTVASWPIYRFLRGQVRWSGTPISWRILLFAVIHTLNDFSVVNETEWVRSLSHVRLFVTPWTVAYQDPWSMGFSRQENWSWLPFPSPGDLSDPGIEPGPPALQADSLLSEPSEKFQNHTNHCSLFTEDLKI